MAESKTDWNQPAEESSHRRTNQLDGADSFQANRLFLVNQEFDEMGEQRSVWEAASPYQR
jgi:hypothetical protein